MKIITSKFLLTLSVFLGLLCSVNSYAAPMLDIAILMDSSGSMGSSGWNNEEDFVSKLIISGIPYEDTRLGIIQFSSSYTTKQIYGFEDQQDDRQEISDVVQDMYYRGGSTYMKKAVDTAINLFDTESAGENAKAIIMLTDGNPYPSYSQSPCTSVYKLNDRGINVFIVGMGSGWTMNKIDCLVEDPNLDIIATNSTSAYDLATAMEPLTERLGAISGISFATEIDCVEGGAIWDSNSCRAAWPSDAEPVNEPAILFMMLFGFGGMFSLRRYKK